MVAALDLNMIKPVILFLKIYCMFIFKTVAKMNHNVQISLNETLKDAQTDNYIGASTKIKRCLKWPVLKGSNYLFYSISQFTFLNLIFCNLKPLSLFPLGHSVPLTLCLSNITRKHLPVLGSMTFVCCSS